jgi:T5SS/PEP-CTERM-associated repeat protein
MCRLYASCETLLKRLVLLALFAASSLAGPLASARADITPTDDVSPSSPPPANWTNLTMGFVGNTASGALTVNGGSHLYSLFGYIGNSPAATGVIAVDGTGSTWNAGSIYVGNSGSGTLTIENSGAVSNGNNFIFIGNNSGSTGMVSVDGANSTLTSNGFVYIGYCGSGTISIANQGSAADSYGTIGYKPGSSGSVTVTGLGSTWTNGVLEVGGSGAGSLSITSGGSVSSNSGVIGSSFGSTGAVTVAGAGSKWTAGSLCVGNSGSGTLSIASGGSVSCTSGFVGSSSASVGLVTVNGGDSTWTNTANIEVGVSGRGALAITNGGSVSSNGGCIGFYPGSTGVVSVTGAGSKWTTGSATLFVGSSGSAALSIAGGGSVTSGSTVVAYATGSKGAVMVDGAGSTWNAGTVEIGDGGSGTLSITNGGHVIAAGTGYLGYNYRQTGLATVAGAGSTWTNTAGLFVGYNGTGTLSVVDGGSVSSTSGKVSYGSLAKVDGAGSAWNDSGSLSIGSTGGTLSISGGGSVTAQSVSLTSGTSLLAIDVGRNSLLTIGGGTGAITNNGTIRFLAGAGVPTDGVQYTPISVGMWNNNATYQAVGGRWSAGNNNYVFTASTVTSGTSNSAVPLDLALVQRALVKDNGSSGTNWEVGASFLAAGSTTEIGFTATAMDNTVLNILKGQLSWKESVLSGWQFETSNYDVSSTKPVYLSFNVGADHPADELEIWHYDANGWAKCDAFDLTYDGTYASFTATSFSGYAMVAVPEPGTLVLFAAGVLGLLTCVSRRRG